MKTERSQKLHDLNGVFARAENRIVDAQKFAKTRGMQRGLDYRIQFIHARDCPNTILDLGYPHNVVTLHPLWK